VSVQARILELLARVRDRGVGILIITHDLGVVAGLADRVAVMYAGRIVEHAPVEQLFATPAHPYTAALLAAMPERSVGHSRLATIPGVVPGLYDRPSGCLFSPRCAYATRRCERERPVLRPWEQGLVRCHYPMGDPLREQERMRDGPVEPVAST
jgi:dipeptide transport system ATP-binding protein